MTNQFTEIFEPDNIEKLPWYIRAAQLLKFTDTQFQFDFDFGGFNFFGNNSQFRIDEFEKLNNWYRKYNCYLINYGNKKIAVYCCENAPKQIEIQRVINNIGSEFEKLLIVMEDGEGFELIIPLPNHQIEFHYQYQLISELVDFKNYEKQLKRQFNENKLLNFNLTLKDIYVPLNAFHYVKSYISSIIEKGHNIINVEQHILRWVNKNKYFKEHLAILGEYGQGKSILSLKIALEMFKNSEDYNRKPIIIELSGKSPRTQNAFSILSEFAAMNGLNPNALYLLHQTGKLLIILEGFDEMDLVGDTEMLFAHFRELWQLAQEPKAKIIITGRPNLFIDDPERIKALRILGRQSHSPYTVAVHLEKMNRQ